MPHSDPPRDASGEMLDPRRLLIFREVARRGSLSAAAAALGWTQPAVGQHVRRLEREVAQPLVLRTARGVRLTPAGEALLGHADAVAASLSAAHAEMRALSTLATGRLRLAAFPSACATLVPPALARLAAAAPGLEVRLTELEPPEARAAVLAGDADLALLFAYATDTGDAHRDLVTTPLRDDPVRAVLPAGHPAAGDTATEVDLAALAGERWVTGCPRCRTHFTALAAAAGFEPATTHVTDDYVVVQNLVAAGLAVALLPGLALEAAPTQGVRALPLAGRPARRIGVAHRRETAATPAVRAGVAAIAAVSGARPRP